MKKIKELDFVLGYLDKVQRKEVSPQYVNKLKEEKIISGEVEPLVRKLSFENENNELNAELSSSDWEKLEKEYYQNKLSDSDV